MSALVVDTSAWISYFAHGTWSFVIEDHLQAGNVLLPIVVAAEILSGKLTDARRIELVDLLGDLPSIGLDANHWFEVGKLRSRFAGRGLTVSTPDAHVALAAIERKAFLLSEDKVFEKVAKVSDLRLWSQD